MAEQSGEKQHDATPHRRQQAREEGQVAKSQDLSSAVLLMAAVLGLWWLGGGVMMTIGEMARDRLGSRPVLQVDHTFAALEGRQMIWVLAQTVLPLMGLLLLVAVGVHLAQVGFLFLPSKVQLDFKHISIFKGVQRLLSLQSAVRLGFGLMKVALVACVAIVSLWTEYPKIITLSELAVPQVANYLSQVVFWTSLKIAAALLILAVIDYAFQRWKHSQDLRMTDQEVREEMKNLQGDPQMLSRRRTVQRQMVLNRLEGAVPRAEVVVTNPTHLAVAIEYDPETMVAPVVVAKGAGLIAQRIRRLALEHDVPIIERKPLAQALYHEVDIGRPVPNEQYAAVAELLRYVYELKGKTLPGVEKAA